MTRRSRWLIILGSFILGLSLLVFLALRPLERVLIAVSVARANIFTPPPGLPGESSFSCFRDAALFYWDFSAIRVARQQRLKEINPGLRPLIAEINRREAAGENMHYSMHIYREIRWRLNFTSDLTATRAQVADLRRSLDQIEEQRLSTEQDPSDGSWARGINTWYLRLYYSVDQIQQCQAPPRYPLAFLDHINSPQKLRAQLDSALYNDFTRTGAFNREELDETFSAIARILASKDRIACYQFDPRLPEALRAFVVHWQNPATGCWGQWLIDRQGRVWKMDDMGMTFHVVSDLHGHVDHLDKIARRLLELDRVNFPAGILFDGHYENHLNMDAVKILHLAWPFLDEPTRQKARAEIAGMLHWCLTHSYQPDGSFKVSDLDDTPGDAYRYGIWFLQEVGYFEPVNRFWTDQDFPDSGAVRKQIEARLQATGLSDPALREAFDALHAMN